MRIVFMGTPDFAACSLQRLIDDGFDVVGVFCQPDKPKNRGHRLMPCAVKETALAAGLPVFQPDKLRDGSALAQLIELSLHRITGDGAKRDLIAPLWSADKKRVLNYLNRYLAE